MIKDNIVNRNLYRSRVMDYCLSFLAGYKGLPVGRVELVEGIYALVQDYTAKDITQGKLEAHRNYVDIQYIVSGSEHIGYCARTNPAVKTEYNPDKDVEFYVSDDEQGGTVMSMLSMRAGDFAVFYPDDLHMPGIGKDNVNKIVVKIPLKLLI